MTETLQDESFFIPSEDGNTTETKYTPKVAGEYLGHITDLKESVREFNREGRDLKARIYNFKVRVASENTTMTYTYQDKHGNQREHDGTSYVDREIVADGVFRFLEPQNGDTFESNASQNQRYSRFCEALGIETKQEERTVNGKTVKVHILPSITAEHVNGTPVIAVVGRGKDWVNNEGKTVPSWRAKFVKRWESGKRLSTVTSGDLPF
jgi:hypothetical protein